MIPTNILFRVFQIRCGSGTGTIFALDFESRQYLVTASHIVGEFADGQIEIRHDDAWKTLRVEFVGSTNEHLDVSVFAAEILLCSAEFTAEPSLAGALLGQEMHFLGFPFGWRGPSTDLLRRAPLPFVKRASLSMLDVQNGNMFLDGMNNPGFSGGPVVFRVLARNEWRIGGVVTGYHDVSDYIQVNGESTSLQYYSNSGLIYVTPIKKILEVIKGNPIGFLLSEITVK